MKPIVILPVFLGLALIAVIAVSVARPTPKSPQAVRATYADSVTQTQEPDGLHVRNAALAYEMTFPKGWIVRSPVDPEHLQLLDARAQQQDPAVLELVQGMKVEVFTTDEETVQAAYERSAANGRVSEASALEIGRPALRFTGTLFGNIVTLVDWDSDILNIVGYMPEPSLRDANTTAYDAIVDSLTSLAE